MTTIYVLLENDQIRYIGKTRKTNLKEKLVQHMDEAVSNPKKFEWIENLSREGKSPDIKPVFSYKDEEAEYYEKMFINDYKFFSGLKMGNQESFHPENFIRKIKQLKEEQGEK